MSSEPTGVPAAAHAAGSGGVVGRESELERLRGFVRTVDEGPSALILEGAPGAGKTTLWRVGVETARDRGLQMLRTRPAEAEAKLAFAGLADLFEQVLDEALPALPPPQRHALAVALLLEEAKAVPPDDRAVHAAVLGVLRSLSARRPLLVAIDDVQWLDAPSAAALRFAFRRLVREPVRILLSLRTEGAPRSALELETAIDPARLTRVTVGPLTLGAVHQLVRTRLGLAFPRPTLRRLHETAHGNPFFVLELGRALKRRGGRVPPGDPLPVPDDLGELVSERLADLPDTTLDALLAASALSHPTVDLVERPGGGVLEPAVAAHVVEIEASVVRFTHPLLASVLYARAPAARRRALHRRLAELVGDPEERARHLALSADGPDETVAAALERAAEAARARGATAAAADLAEQACALTPRALAEDLARRTLAAARHRFRAGDPDRARTLLEGIAPTTAGQSRAEALALLARILRWQGDQPRALELARGALAIEGIDDATRADLEHNVGATLFYLREELEAARTHLSRSIELAARAKRDDLRLEALGQKVLVDAAVAAPEARETLRTAEELEARARTLWVLSGVAFVRGYASLWHDDPETAAAAVRAALADAAAVGDDSAASLALVALAQAEYLRGDWRKAVRLVDDAYDSALQTGQRPQEALALATRALLQASLGDEERARRDAASALAITGPRAMAVARIHAVWALGVLELSLDRPEQAVALLAPERERVWDAGVREPGSIRFVGDEAEALAALGRDEQAERLCSWLDECGRVLGRSSALGAAHRTRASLAAQAGDAKGTLRRLESAVAEWERAGNPFELARTLLLRGRVERRARQNRAARETLREALTLFERLGARLWAERAGSELARIGGRVPSRDDLTPTEARVAALVAEGKTNREVAAALVVAERTVEFHLSNVYRKLGVRSRAELTLRLESSRSP